MKLFKQLLPLLAILVGAACVYYFGWHHHFTYSALKENHEAIKSSLAQHPVITPVYFVLIYICLEALAIPGAFILAVLGGYLFPEPLSTIYVVFSATCGSTLLFLATQMAFKPLFKHSVKPFLQKMRSGFQKNGANYMLCMRLIPLFPFWVVNVAPAFLGLRAKTFIWTTCVGLIPISLVLTYFGKHLDKIFESNKPFTMSAIFVTEVKMGLIALGLLTLTPVLWKKIKKR